MIKEKLIENKNKADEKIKKIIEKQEKLRFQIEELDEKLGKEVKKQQDAEWELATKHGIWLQNTGI